MEDTDTTHVDEAWQLQAVHTRGDKSAGNWRLQRLRERGVLRSAGPAIRELAASGVHVNRSCLW
jgi:hypothetical protein